jgi:ParB-like chromosome segregation protein Spo0J
MRTHRYNIFPKLSTAELDTLKEDLKARGQQDPIYTYEDEILDGQNRYHALTQLGVPEDKITFVAYTGDDPIGFTLSANLHRRHLDEAGRAFIAAKIATLALGDNQHTGKGKAAKGTSIEVASELLSVSRASVERAKRILKLGVPELLQAVETGNLSLALGAEISKQSPEDQTSSVEGISKDGPLLKPSAIDAFDALADKLVKKLQEMDIAKADDAATKTAKRLREVVNTKKAEANKKAAA